MTAIETELRDTVKTLNGALRRKSPRLASVLLADLFAELPGVPASKTLQDAAARTATALQDTEARAVFFSLGLQLWNRLSATNALSRERARVLATRLAPCAGFPQLLFFLERDADARGFDDVKAVFAGELDDAFPSFRAQRGVSTFGLPLLHALGATRDGIDVKLDSNEQLKRLSVKNGGPTLNLTAPGVGTFSETGKAGGYGFAVGEKYEAGAVHTTFCSPWHDGEESTEKKEWVCWVLECIGSITSRVASGGRASRG